MEEQSRLITPPGSAQSLHVTSTWDGTLLPASQHIEISFWLDQTSGHIAFSAPFYNDPPPSAPQGSTPQLWEHEVVEVFVAGSPTQDGWPYLELEFGPHGHYLLLQLSAVRKLKEQGFPCTYKARLQGQRWQGYAQVPRTLFPPQPWTWNAYAIHGSNQTRQYLAAFPTPGTQPDFHQPACFRPLVCSPSLHDETPV